MQALLTLLVLPPVGLLLLALLCLRWRWLSGLALLAALLLAVPGVVDPLARAYADAPPAAELLARADAWRGRPDAVVLVLGAGVKPGGALDGGYELKPRTAERLRRGLAWSRRLGLPLAFSGGLSSREPGAPSEAAVVRQVLTELGQPPAAWLEAQSPDTRGNARFSAAELARHGQRRVLLVTDALHMPRALRHFRTAAPEVEFLAAPLQQEPTGPRRWSDWLPSLGGLQQSHYLAYELLARAVQH